MLNLRVHPMVARQLEVNPRIVTLSEAVSIMFRVMYGWPVKIDDDGTTIRVTSLKNGNSLAEACEGAKPRDFQKLRLLSQLAAVFMEYRAGKVDFAAVQKAAIDAAGNRTVPTLDNIARDDIGGMIAYMLGWLLRRRISARLTRDEHVVALVSRLAPEMDS